MLAHIPASVRSRSLAPATKQVLLLNWSPRASASLEIKPCRVLKLCSNRTSLAEVWWGQLPVKAVYLDMSGSVYMWYSKWMSHIHKSFYSLSSSISQHVCLSSHVFNLTSFFSFFSQPFPSHYTTPFFTVFTWCITPCPLSFFVLYPLAYSWILFYLFLVFIIIF